MKRRTFLRSTGAVLGSTLLGQTALGVPGGSTATILTDAHGVSHIYAEDQYSLVFANGYVQARDRLFQMDVLRHIGYGNSAEVLGPGQLASDIEVRRDLYTRDELQAQYDAASEQMKELLTGFADGVNKQMTEMAAENRLPGTFTALTHSPDPWDPVDSIAVLSYLIGYFGLGGGSEIGNARELAVLTDTLGERAAAYEAFGDRNWLRVGEEHPASLDPDELTVEGGETVPSFEDVPDEQLSYVDATLDAEPWGIESEFSLSEFLSGVGKGLMEGFKFGSNALIVGGEHTETGAPMLGGGPQMGYFKPPVIHQVGLHGAGFDVTGIGTVGAPGVIIGRTPEFAWTVTSGRDDQTDTIAVDLHPDDDHRYEWNGEYHEMETHTIVHTPSVVGSIIEGDPDIQRVEQEVARIEEAGATMPVVAWNPDERVAWCQRTTTRMQELEGALMWAHVGTETDYEGFKSRLSDFPFTFNFHYVDADDIGFVHTGAVPERNPDLDHRLPAPASLHEWGAITTGTGLGIHTKNPDSGYVVNWNNAPVVGWRAGDAPQQWGGPNRVVLLDDLTASAIDDGPLSLADVKGIIEDAATHDAAAAYTVPAMIDAARGADDSQLQAMADELDQWRSQNYRWSDANDDGAYDSGGMAIYEETRRELQMIVFDDDIRAETPGLAFDPPLTRHAADHGRAQQDTTIVSALSGETAHDWLNGEDSTAIFQQALTAAASTLAERYGTATPGEWQLSVRQSTFRSLGASNQTAIEMVNRATYNQAVAMGTGLEGSQHILAPANSGHITLGELTLVQLGFPEPARLTDQLEEYTIFEYIPNAYSRSQVESIATDERTL